MNSKRHIASILIEGELDPFRTKGGLLDLKVIIKCMTKLGFRVRLYARLAENVSSGSAEIWLGNVELIELKSETSLAKFKRLNAESLRIVTNQLGGVAIFMGMGAIRMASPPKKALTVLLPGLPEYMLIYPRFRYVQRTNKVNLYRLLLQTGIAFYEYSRTYTIHMLSRKVVDVVVAQDPKNARMHRQCARSEVKHYPSPLLDTAQLGTGYDVKTQTVVMANAPGTHSDAAIEYFCNEISPHIIRSDYNFLHVGRDVLPAPLRQLGRRINIVNIPFTDKFEELLCRSNCLLFTSPIPVGASTRVKAAMMCSTVPIVHPAVLHGLPELIPDYNCLVGRNGAEFVSHINKVMDDRDFRETIGSNARATYSKFFTVDKAEAFWSSIVRRTNAELSWGCDQNSQYPK